MGATINSRSVIAELPILGNALSNIETGLSDIYSEKKCNLDSYLSCRELHSAQTFSLPRFFLSKKANKAKKVSVFSHCSQAESSQLPSIPFFCSSRISNYLTKVLPVTASKQV